MKRFIILSLTACLLLVANKAWACAGGDYGHYAEVFNIYSHTYTYDNSERLMQYWINYTGDRTPLSGKWKEERYYPLSYFFEKDCARLFAAAKKKHDEEMLLYLRQTIKYNKICSDMQNRWDYPSAEELAQRRKTLLGIQRAAKAYRGERLKAQFSLLYMRANLLLKQYQANQEYWVLVASKYPASVFKDMMHSLYANAILNLGQWRKACDIYAKQGDWESVEWAMRNYRNPAGIRRIYKEDPNSPTLAYLLQYYVNGGYGWEYSYSRYNEDSNDFYANLRETEEFAQFIETEVLTNRNVSDKAMWKAAEAVLYFYAKKFDVAYKNAQEALKLNGSKRSRHSARCVAFLTSTRSRSLGEAYSTYLVGEIQWLIARAIEKESNNDYTGDASYYQTVLDHVMYNYLIPRYEVEGTTNERLALMALLDGAYSIRGTEEDSELPNIPYSLDYVSALDSVSASQLVAYYEYLNSNVTDPLQRLALIKANKNAEYFNELIGTAYLREGEFAAAIPYLEKVSVAFINKRGYSSEARGTDFTLDRWFTRRPYPKEADTKVPLTENPKLKYCRDMVQLQSRYRLARNKEIQAQLAYTLASRYFQASIYGDCWYLTRDYLSRSDSVRTYEMDFVSEAITYLRQSQESKKGDLKLKSLFALAHVVYAPPTACVMLDHGSWFEGLDDYGPVLVLYKELAEYVKTLKKQPDYITQCDILQEFISTKMN